MSDSRKVDIELPPNMTKEQLETLLKRATTPDENDVIFKTIEKENGELRIYRGTYKDREKLAIQFFYRDNKDGLLKPGKGATIHYEDIDDIVEGLMKMKEWCEENPREDSDGLNDA